MRAFSLIVLIFLCSAARGEFIHPNKADDALVYGVKGGIVIAVHPFGLDRRKNGGPRGLLRVGYEEDGKRYLINYIAVEPLVGRARGFSELEKASDGKPGKRFWIGDDIRDGGIGKNGNIAGRIHETAQGRALTFVLHVEHFDNGARPIVEVTLFERFPDRVRFRTHSAEGGKTMNQCVLTATMGNQSRCRSLWLRSKAVFAPSLYAGYQGNDFVEKDTFAGNELHRTEKGDVVVAISPNEYEPREVWPLASGSWHHDGRWMAQFWLKAKGAFDQTLQCRVNGRRVYWAGDTPIPGGIAYENFELREEFHPGRELWFGYSSASPAKAFGFPYDASPQATGPRRVPAEESAQILDAAKVGRPLTNGLFRAGLDGWQQEGGASSFRTVPQEDEISLTTYGKNKEADTGRLYQCFQVPKDASELRFFLRGGADFQRTYVALWHGERERRRMTARESNVSFQVRWDLKPLRGQVVTLEIVDESTGPWGFIGVDGFTLLGDKQVTP